MPDVNGLVSDPQFQKLSPADQRAALTGVTGDQSFSSLSDADTSAFVTRTRSTGNGTSAKPSFLDRFNSRMAGNIRVLGDTPAFVQNAMKGVQAYQAQKDPNQNWFTTAGQ